MDMKMSPMAICGSRSLLRDATLIVLLFYPLVVCLLTSSYRRARGDLARASIAFATPALFLGLAATWLGFTHVLMSRALTGGGLLSTAAGIADALVPLAFACVVAAIVSLAFLLQARRAEWRPRRMRSWLDGGSLGILTAVLGATFAFTREVAAPRVSFEAARVVFFALAALAIIAFIVAVRRVRVVDDRAPARPAYLLAIATALVCVAMAWGWWSICQRLSIIASRGY